MSQPPTLRLSVDGICSKWGNGDGDTPDHLLDYWDDIGVDYNSIDWHEVLRKLVRSHLVPAIEAAGHTVEVYDIDTCHNPVRASTIDGMQIDDYANDAPFELDVTVPYADVAEAAGLSPRAVPQPGETP